MAIYISLTSIFQRQHTLFKCLTSILRLHLRPTKCFIYLSEEPYLIDKGFKNKEITNDNLKKILENNIFQVKWVKNTGPYRKLIPLLKEKWDENCLIFTFDDDLILHPQILSYYMNDFIKYRCCISYRGFNTTINNIDEFNYSNRTKQSTRSKFNFANSGVGMITHPAFFHKEDLILNEDIFLKICPTADDLWYYICRVLNNIPTIIVPYENRLFSVGYDRDTALWHNYNEFKNKTIFKNIIAFLKKKGISFI